MKLIFLFQLIILGHLGQEGLINYFLMEFSWMSLKNGNKHETCFYKCLSDIIQLALFKNGKDLKGTSQSD